mmetsp:Transcript_24038/g.58809  ORF Transcript_24038/g.58809 Transcript_24038/m.58809 type:complete len:92 (-) Transcript_24038:933-1208(-)
MLSHPGELIHHLTLWANEGPMEAGALLVIQGAASGGPLRATGRINLHVVHEARLQQIRDGWSATPNEDCSEMEQEESVGHCAVATGQEFGS